MYIFFFADIFCRCGRKVEQPLVHLQTLQPVNNPLLDLTQNILIVIMSAFESRHILTYRFYGENTLRLTTRVVVQKGNEALKMTVMGAVEASANRKFASRY